MTLEERIELLEGELAKLRGKPVVYATSAYAVARQNCKAHFEAVKAEGQHYGAEMVCEQAARSAFKERNGIEKGRDVPSHYIKTEDDGREYFELFKAFLEVYQNYLRGNELHYEQAG